MSWTGSVVCSVSARRLRLASTWAAAVAQVIIELAAGAELQQVQGEAPPGQEARGVGAGLRDARVGEAVEPGVELGEEVADGLDQGAAGDQGRPALSFRQPGLGPEQGHRQLVDLVEEGLEAFVFGEPCADLGEQVFGDVDGAGLAVP